MSGKYRLSRGTLVVLEGLDKTGKTTQRRALEALPWADPAPAVVHMPSGVSEISAQVYGLLEEQTIDSPLSRQLLHLACHAESMPYLRAARKERGIILDRWWWSTVAYGIYGAPRVELDDVPFLSMVRAIWEDFEADVVFLFRTSHESDPHNAASIESAYGKLAVEDSGRVVEVPLRDPAATTEFLLGELVNRSLLATQVLQ